MADALYTIFYCFFIDYTAFFKFYIHSETFGRNSFHYFKLNFAHELNVNAIEPAVFYNMKLCFFFLKLTEVSYCRMLIEPGWKLDSIGENRFEGQRL